MALDGFWISGVCARTQAQALDILNAQYPLTEGGMLHHGNAVANGINGATITTQSMNLSVVGDVWISHISSIIFNACDTSLTLTPQIDAAGILSVFSWGFGAVMLSFSWGLTIYWAITAIKKS